MEAGSTDKETRKEFFLAVRDRYNEKNLDPIENTTKFFFLNRTCFNGLYRVNKKGLFNVPFGKYANPQICDPMTIRKDSELLQRVEIMTGDFEETFQHANDNTLFYFDPPYRPLSDTSSFNDYTKEAFNDDAQIRLKEYCDRIHAAGFKFMLSNSDCKGKNEADSFFEVEHSTDIQNSVAKFCDLQDYHSRFIIVAPENRHEQFNKVMDRTIFHDIKDRVLFRSYEVISKQYTSMCELQALSGKI